MLCYTKFCEWFAPPALAVWGAVLYIFFGRGAIRFRKSFYRLFYSDVMLQWQQIMVIGDAMRSPVSLSCLQVALYVVRFYRVLVKTRTKLRGSQLRGFETGGFNGFPDLLAMHNDRSRHRRCGTRLYISLHTPCGSVSRDGASVGCARSGAGAGDGASPDGASVSYL